MGCLFLFFTAIALYFDIVEILGPCLSLPNKRTKFVNLHELLPPKLYLLETLILLVLFTQVFLYNAAGKDGKKWVNPISQGVSILSHARGEGYLIPPLGNQGRTCCRPHVAVYKL